MTLDGAPKAFRQWINTIAGRRPGNFRRPLKGAELREEE